MSDSKQNSDFESWIKTGAGKRASDFNTLTSAEFLRNRLWHAYHAGQQSGDVSMHTPVHEVIQEIATKKSKYITNSLKTKAKYIINNISDFTIKNIEK